MANFTQTQARGCTIVRTVQIKNGSTHIAWAFGVKDSDGNYYSWADKTTSSRASKATIKTAIETHLKNNMTKQAAPVTYSRTAVTNKGLNETVG